MRKVAYLFLGFSLVLLAGCGKSEAKKEKKHGTRIIVAQKHSTSTVLYFNGVLKPKSIVNVPAPVDAQIEKVNFHFGSKVKKGDLLLTLESTKLQQEYQTALSDYLKAKEAYATSENKWIGTNELRKLGLISDNDYSTELQTRESTTLSYYQKRQKLLTTLRKTQENADGLMKKIKSLSFSNVEAVNKALNAKNEQMRVIAPISGTVLYPEKSGGGKGTPQLNRGTAVKKGSGILAIGDLGGLRLHIDVNEINVLQLKPGMEVTVSGVAFPGIILKGKIESIATQATTGSGGLPVFGVDILIPEVTPKQRVKVHVGMSARIEVEIKHPPIIQIPIAAVHESSKGSIVEVKGKDGKIKKVPVETGKTGLSDVVITKGIKPGDHIVVPN